MVWTIKLSRNMRVAADAAREVGEYMVAEWHKLSAKDIREKAPGDHVTRVDRECEEMIKKVIVREFPGDAMLGEESGGQIPKEGPLWLIDPLDGTRNYIHHVPFFSVSIGFALDGTMQMGVIYDPLRKEMFCCKRDEGVWLNDSPIRVSEVADISQAIVATECSGRMRDVMPGFLDRFGSIASRAGAVRAGGSAALGLAYVACGRYDAFWHPSLFPWDMAAGALMIEAAGGMVSAGDGGTWRIDSGSVFASNFDLHGVLQGMIKGGTGR